jgi:hypothetical protein
MGAAVQSTGASGLSCSTSVANSAVVPRRRRISIIDQRVQLGAADRVIDARRGALEAVGASWTMGGEEDGCALCRMRDVRATPICVPARVARRAAGGPSKAEPGADAGPAAPPAPP